MFIDYANIRILGLINREEIVKKTLGKWQKLNEIAVFDTVNKG